MTRDFDSSGDAVRELIDLMDLLRSPGGCPWDADQTHESLLEYLLEEAYETVDAVHSGDRPALREELGDVLLQVVFHARIAQEHSTDPFDVDDVARGITEKLRRRHPHVFAGEATPAPGEAQARWEELKAAEKQRASVTDGVPDAMPASLLAVKLLGRAGRKVETSAVRAVDDQVAWESAQAALASVESGSAAVQSAEGSGSAVDSAVGSLLLAIIA
ncbi:MAG: MazG family protein, partial [Actinobacteria bacterium]|nr:MazG family protein [Actinomycetota bacterium]